MMGVGWRTAADFKAGSASRLKHLELFGLALPDSLGPLLRDARHGCASLHASLAHSILKREKINSDLRAQMRATNKKTEAPLRGTQVGTSVSVEDAGPRGATRRATETLAATTRENYDQITGEE
jgi:hypothetical protein